MPAPLVSTNPDHARLYQGIREFRFDEGSPAFPFLSRLERENGWSRAYAARVITEYRRFAFLAVAAGHPVTPSDQVDQVWHMHLLYTRSYWERFCRTTLERPLHHEPTQGGQAETEKFRLCYDATLESYRRFFGEEAPQDIWPEADRRFGEDIHFERVNKIRFWVIPRRQVRRVAAVAGFFLLALLITNA